MLFLENINNFNNYFIYVYLDPRNTGEYRYNEIKFEYKPIYIGKGKGNRHKRHFFLCKKSNTRFHNKISSILKNGKDPIVIIIKDNLNEKEAFIEESNMILLIGRIENGGPLLNLTDVGEGQSGYKHRDESKLKTSNSIKNNKEWQKYVKSSEFREKVSKGLMGHEGYGKGVPRTQEVKNKISKSVSGEKNHFYNKNHSEESKKKMSEKRTGSLNSNSKSYTISIDDNQFEFTTRQELEKFINEYNKQMNLSGPKRVSTDSLIYSGKSKNFKLIKVVLNRKI